MSLLKWFGLADDADTAPHDSVGEIERALTELDPREARYLACFAYILHRVASADHDISADESVLIEALVASHAGLAADRAALVTRIARTQHLHHGGTEDFIVTREFEKTATREQKLALLECLFAVSAIDQSIRTVEDNEIRRVAAKISSTTPTTSPSAEPTRRTSRPGSSPPDSIGRCPIPQSDGYTQFCHLGDAATRLAVQGPLRSPGTRPALVLCRCRVV